MYQNKYRFILGNFRCTIFRDLMWKYKAQDYFINANQQELQEEMDKFQLNPDHISSPFIAILLQNGDKNILIDTGAGYSDEPLVFRGNSFELKGKLVHLLQEEGIEKEDITDVIITHFHLDHIGGIYSDKAKLNFPNAKFHLPKDEWNFWHSSKSDSQIPLFKWFVENKVTPLKEEYLNLIEGELTDILPGIKAVTAPGHTPGQIALIIGNADEPLLYISDAFLHPIHIERINWRTNYDFDHEKATKTREKLLDLANSENMLVNGFHFNFPGLGHVSRKGPAWRWEYIKKS